MRSGRLGGGRGGVRRPDLRHDDAALGADGGGGGRIAQVPDPWVVLGVSITQDRRDAYLAVPGDDGAPSPEDV